MTRQATVRYLYHSASAAPGVPLKRITRKNIPAPFVIVVMLVKRLRCVMQLRIVSMEKLNLAKDSVTCAREKGVKCAI
ncbi:hypothetical protein TNCV_886931 [Trichonephila clavipes]|uniref:Uncharacterized protein n=1 Tax=Trichonephila clavipes TaxID=2585209 RepID=A0A8X6R9I1_TRICX|nr:hypothetical protein TNCV_886931 [Trichonephila clavipes]